MNWTALKKSSVILLVIAAAEYGIMQALHMAGAVDTALGSVADTALLIIIVAPFLYKRFRAEERNSFLARSIRESEEKYHLLFRENPSPMWVFDSETLDFKDVNEAAVRHYGYSREEFLSMKLTEIRPPEEVPVLLDALSKLSPDLQKAGIWTHRKKDGTRMDVEITTKGVMLDGRRSMLVLANDVTERERAFRDLENSESRQRALLDNIPDIAWLKDAESRFVAVNESFAESCGFGTEGLAGKTDLDIWPRELAERYRADDLEVIRSGRRKSVEEPLIDKDGRELLIETIKTPVFDERHNIIGTAGIARDITRRKLAEENASNLNRLYSFLTEINKAILRTSDMRELLQEACAIAVETGNFRMAWAGIIDEDSKTVKPAAQAGHVEGYLDGIVVSVSDSDEGRGPTGAAARHGVHFISADIGNDPKMKPWREEALKRGYLSSAGFPLRQGNKVIGVISFYSNKKDYFGDEEVNLLDSFARDISYALTHLAEEEMRLKAERALHERNERLAMLNRIDKAMVSNLELDSIADVLIESLAGALKMESGAFYIFDPVSESLKVEKCFNWGYDKADPCLSLSFLPGMHDAVKSGGPVAVEGLDGSSPLYRAFGIQSYLLLPLSTRTGLHGLISLFNINGPHAFTDDEITFAGQVADQAVVAIMNAELIKNLKDRETSLIDRNIELAALNQISSVISESLDLRELLQRVLDKTLSFPFLEIQKKGVIFVRDEKEPETFVMAASAGLAQALLDSERTIKAGHCLCGLAARTGEIIDSDNCFTDPNHTTSYPGMKEHGHIVLPLKRKDIVLGIMTFYLEPGIKTTRFEKQILSAIASQLAIAIENRRLFQSILSGKKEWEATFDSIEDVITIHGPDYRILRANRAVSKVLGLPPNEIIGRKCYELFHGADSPMPGCPARDLLAGNAGGLGSEFESGGRFFEVNCYPVREGEELGAVVHIVKDVTERRLAQKALMHRLAVEEAVSEASSLLLSEEDADFTRVLSILGAAIGSDRSHVLLLDDDRRVRDVYGWCVREDECGVETMRSLDSSCIPWWMERLSTGQEIAVEDVSSLPSEAWKEKEVLATLNVKSLLAVPLIAEQRLFGFICFGSSKEKSWSKEDVSFVHYAAHDVLSYLERKAAETALRESEGKFRSLVEQTLIGVYINQGNRIRYANPRFAEIFGYAPEEVAGKDLRDFVHPEDWPLVAENIRRREAGEVESLNYTFRGVAKDGRVLYVEVFVNNTSYGGRVAAIVALMDITEKLATQEELLRKTQEAALLEQAKRQLEEVNRLKSEFLANMSHELRTPLNAVIGLSNILLEEDIAPLAAKQAEYLKGINSSGEHLLSLINEILDLSKIEAGKQELEYGNFSLEKILRNSLLLVKEKAMRHRIELRNEISPEVGAFYGDERRIKQVIFNLLSNAVKFTEPGGKVGIKAESRGGEVSITVWDTGIGIPEDKKHLLFQPFQQLDSALSRKHEGTGLGLVLSKKLAEMHGGNISFESREGEGTSFRVTLPVRPAGRPDAEAGRPAREGWAATPLSGKTILIAEDNELNMLLASDYLKMKGVSVIEAFDGESALLKIKERVPDMVLLDIQMPGVDGLEVARRLREDPETADVPIIAMTALAMKGDEEMCLKSGCDGYIKKPVDLKEMLETIGRHLSKGGRNV